MSVTKRLGGLVLASILAGTVVMLSIQTGLLPLDVPIVTAAGLTSLEQQILGQVNGSRAYDYDLELEEIANNHFEYRSSGSPGAEESANWIEQQFENFGLDASLEPFEFTIWNLTSEPFMAIDEDGDRNTTTDQYHTVTFSPVHLSYYTPSGSAMADLVVLPLPPAANRNDIGRNAINDTEWAVDTTGKILLIGKEVRWSGTWLNRLNAKLGSQTPAALVYTWWYDWMAFTPIMLGSAEGTGYWNVHLPVGSVDYTEGLWIRNRETVQNVSAIVSIESVIQTGIHYNVVGRLEGHKNPEKSVIISSHYDTITCAGFCDNGAGTAGIIELAKIISDFAKNGSYKPRYTLLFVAFAAEEYYLVGSASYVKQHKNEMSNIIAVINLDCIGSDLFFFSETEPDGDFDLDEIVNQATIDLGIGSYVEGPGGSDHETFRNPSWANGMIYNLWGTDLGIMDALAVKSSILLISRPLFYYDEWNSGNAGWIHTSNDNSNSTQTHSWVEVDDLENHVRVAALTLVRVSPSPELPGDVDYSKSVSIYDAIILAKAFGSEPGALDWNPNADIDEDKVVDIYDAIVLANHFGQSIP